MLYPLGFGVWVSFGLNMARYNSGKYFRMGVLVNQPDEEGQNQSFDWNLSVIGSFFGPNPPAASVVQQVVDLH